MHTRSIAAVPSIGRTFIDSIYTVIGGRLLSRTRDSRPHMRPSVDVPESDQYECLECGTIVEARSHPGECECGGEFQNRAKSLE